MRTSCTVILRWRGTYNRTAVDFGTLIFKGTKPTASLGLVYVFGEQEYNGL